MKNTILSIVVIMTMAMCKGKNVSQPTNSLVGQSYYTWWLCGDDEPDEDMIKKCDSRVWEQAMRNGNCLREMGGFNFYDGSKVHYLVGLGSGMSEWHSGIYAIEENGNILCVLDSTHYQMYNDPKDTIVHHEKLKEPFIYELQKINCSCKEYQYYCNGGLVIRDTAKYK